jgi:hypothetical protein
VLLRLAYLGLTNTFALLRLLSMTDRDKDIEILVLRHQIALLQRQLGDTRVRFSPADRALLAALLHRLPRGALHRLRLLVRPDTILRWHRDLAPSTPRHNVATQTSRSATHHRIHPGLDTLSRRGRCARSLLACGCFSSILQWQLGE